MDRNILEKRGIKMKRYDTIIWDMDGTLLETLEDLNDSVNFALKAKKYETKSLEHTRKSVGNGIRKLMELSVPDGEKNPCFEEIFGIFREHYKENCLNKTKPYDGICNLLTRLKNEGYKMAVVSNKVDSAVKELAENFFGGSLNIAIGEHAGVNKKPSPDMVNEAIEKLCAEKKKTVYIGDSEVDVKTAENSGLDIISVLWGFRTEEELKKSGAKVFVKTADELYDYLEK